MQGAENFVYINYMANMAQNLKPVITAPTYVSKSEVAKAFSVSIRTVERWMEHGCPYHRFGVAGVEGMPRFKIVAVEEWLVAQRKGGI